MAKRKIIRIDEDRCTGCGLCLPACAEGALEMVDGKPRLAADKYCDGLGACLGVCPEGALIMEEREAEAFDEAAVEERLHALKTQEQQGGPTGCAGANMARELVGGSNLGHWPVQLRLVPDTAPWLDGAELLLTADCAPVALPGFQERWLPGRKVLLACPKFDDPESSVERLAGILAKNDIAGVTILRMEVPCCGGLERFVRAALRMAGKETPVQEVVVGMKGQAVGPRPLEEPQAAGAVLPGF